MPADLLFHAPISELLDVDRCVSRGRRNPRKSSRWKVDEAALELYGGYEALVVRTAIVRSHDYDAFVEKHGTPAFTSSRDVLAFVEHLRCSDNERVLVFALSAANRLVAIYEAAVGSKDFAAIHVDEIIKVPLLVGSASFIMVHNHPSGDATPSRNDLHLTRTVVLAAHALGIKLIDHIVVAAGQTGKSFSFLDAGLLGSYEQAARRAMNE